MSSGMTLLKVTKKPFSVNSSHTDCSSQCDGYGFLFGNVIIATLPILWSLGFCNTTRHFLLGARGTRDRLQG